MENNWIPIQKDLPPSNTVVETKVSDEGGERNFQDLKRNGGLWFLPDGSMYVYYSPTHWREKSQPINH